MIFPLGPLLHNTAAFAGSVASGTWEPTSLGASLFADFDGRQAGTINTGSSNVWTANAGSGGPLTQATSADRGTYTAGPPGGIVFDATDYLSLASGPSFYDAVMVVTTNASSATWRTFLWAVAGVHPLLLETGTNRLGAFNSGAFQDSGLTIATATAAIVHVRVQDNGASQGQVFLSLNGGTLTSQVTLITGGSTPIAAVGSASGAGQPVGTVHRLVISVNPLGSTDLDKVVGALAWDASLQALLPGGHAYASAHP